MSIKNENKFYIRKMNKNIARLEKDLLGAKNEFFQYKTLSEMFRIVDLEVFRWMELIMKHGKLEDVQKEVIEDEALLYLKELSVVSNSIESLLKSIENEAFVIQRAMLNSFLIKEPIIFKL